MDSRSVPSPLVILAGAAVILVAWATFVWVWSATVLEPWIPIAVTLAVPTLAALAGVNAGMRPAHVLSWAVPSALLILVAFVSRPHPINYLAFTSGFGLPLLLMYSSESQAAWRRIVLRNPDRGR